jgi:glycosyltransferase involved in cell wall biosynthesis
MTTKASIKGAVHGSTRVVHVAPAAFGPHGFTGGGERYVFELARAMASRLPTSLVTFGRAAERYRVGDLDGEVLRNWFPWRRLLAEPINLALIQRLKNADIIHCHQPRTAMSTLALAVARARGIPIFATNLGAGGLRLHDFIDLRHRYAGHLHVSEFSRRAYGHESLASARVIWGGVDTDRFCPDESVRPTDEVLFVGRLVPHKGANYLIEAVGHDVPLRIIGQRWWKTQDAPYYGLLRRLMEGRRVTLDESCDDGGLVDAYRRALCIVLPSVYVTAFGERYKVPELLGQTLLEGMACGRPAICTDVGGMPEVVRDGVTGFVVPPNDPQALRDRIDWLRSHPAEAESMGRAARADVTARFSWSAVVDRCLEAYAPYLREGAASAAS